MSYREKVQNKIQGFERLQERTRLWDEICSAYEQGSIEQVQSGLIEEMTSLKKSFDEVIQKLQSML